MPNSKLVVTYETIPTEENIYYMFQRFVVPIIISTSYIPYKDYWGDYEHLLGIVKKWIGIYYNTKDLTNINNIEEFDNIDLILSNLKFNCAIEEYEYLEEIDIWHNEFLHLWKDSHEK